ncbi:MAG TPA: LysM peptidoglycan-binding domain-containing protein, partial [Longimicrobium sp.]|nr:LysM peptidoglycan-binding domain-containing protein [Longimicrobium sp.]
ARDSVATGRRTTRTARADTASTRRRAASADEDEGDEAPPATRTTRRTSASRDSAAAAARRTAARDSAAARRASSRDTASTRRSTSARPRTHTVAARETLFGIARRYGVTSAQIRAVNPDLGETLEIGTVLRLPAGARAPASRADAAADERDRPAAPRRPAGDADEAPRPAAARRARRHTVVAGETLYGLARRFGVTVDAIRGANRLPSDNLRPGQVLIIPATPPQR